MRQLKADVIHSLQLLKNLMKNFFIVSMLCFFLTSCDIVTQENGFTLNADLLDEGDFTIQTPSEWGFAQGMGIDSQVGTITGDGITLTFAYGVYVGNPIDATESGEKLVAQNETINGRDAVILTPKITGDGEVAVYFKSPYGDGDTLLSDSTYIMDEEHFLLFGENLTAEQEALALQIFRTIKFLRQ